MIASGTLAQIGEVAGTVVRHGVMFEVAPDVFDRIQFRRVGRQMLQGDAPVEAFDVFFDQPRAMRLQAVPDDQQLLADRCLQGFEELDDLRALDRAGEEAKVETPIAHPCDDTDTRAKLRIALAEKGFGSAQLTEMQKITDAEKSDLFDVLSYVAYASPMLSRQERATHAKRGYSAQMNYKQQAFIDFVLSHYVAVGVEELSKEKLTPLRRLKYHDLIADAVAELGRPEDIGKVFAGFQRHLYEKVVLLAP